MLKVLNDHAERETESLTLNNAINRTSAVPSYSKAEFNINLAEEMTCLMHSGL